MLMALVRVRGVLPAAQALGGAGRLEGLLETKLMIITMLTAQVRKGR
jgi:hypothetical protein